MAHDVGLVAVTGARGYLGSLIVKKLGESGIETLPLSRPAAGLDGSSRPFDLSANVAPETLTDVSIVVHCAWDLAATSWREMWSTNVEGTLKLVEAANAARVSRFVFISSMSAYVGTRQMYGLAKLACERAVLRWGGVVVRPGLVYGAPPGGMFAKLVKMVQLPIVPVIAGGLQQYLVEAGDFSEAITRLVVTKDVPSKPIGAAHPDPVKLKQLLYDLGRAGGRTKASLPLPGVAVYAAMRAAEGLGVKLPFRSDSLLGLMRPAPCLPNADVLQALGVEFKSYMAGRDEVMAALLKSAKASVD